MLSAPMRFKAHIKTLRRPKNKAWDKEKPTQKQTPQKQINHPQTLTAPHKPNYPP
jgi:hypothetical protein